MALSEDEKRRRKSEYRKRKRKTDPVWRERDRKADRAYYYRHPARRMLYSAKNRAQSLGLPFALTEADLHLPDVCPALGIPIRYGPGGRGPDSPSLDRLRPDRGYVPNNVRVVSDRANRIKNDASADEIAAVARWLRKELKQ